MVAQLLDEKHTSHSVLMNVLRGMKVETLRGIVVSSFQSDLIDIQYVRRTAIMLLSFRARVGITNILQSILSYLSVQETVHMATVNQFFMSCIHNPITFRNCYLHLSVGHVLQKTIQFCESSGRKNGKQTIKVSLNPMTHWSSLQSFLIRLSHVKEISISCANAIPNIFWKKITNNFQRLEQIQFNSITEMDNVHLQTLFQHSTKLRHVTIRHDFGSNVKNVSRMALCLQHTCSTSREMQSFDFIESLSRARYPQSRVAQIGSLVCLRLQKINTSVQVWGFLLTDLFGKQIHTMYCISLVFESFNY